MSILAVCFALNWACVGSASLPPEVRVGPGKGGGNSASRLAVTDSFYGTDYFLEVQTAPASLIGHRLQSADEPHGVVARVDGEPCWGDRWETFKPSSGRLPLNRLSKVVIGIGQRRFNLGSAALAGLFDINLPGQGKGSIPRWVDYRNHDIYFQLVGGDTYFVVFRIKAGGSSCERSVFLGEGKRPMEQFTSKLEKR